MVEIRTNNFTAKDMFNAATATPLKTVIGQTLNIVAVWVTERPDLNGVVKTVANLKTDDGSIYGTISDSVIRSVMALPEMLEESDSVAIEIEERPGTEERNYLVATLV